MTDLGVGYLKSQHLSKTGKLALCISGTASSLQVSRIQIKHKGTLIKFFNQLGCRSCKAEDYRYTVRQYKATLFSLHPAVAQDQWSGSVALACMSRELVQIEHLWDELGRRLQNRMPKPTTLQCAQLHDGAKWAINPSIDN